MLIGTPFKLVFICGEPCAFELLVLLILLWFALLLLALLFYMEHVKTCVKV